MLDMTLENPPMDRPVALEIQPPSVTPLPGANTPPPEECALIALATIGATALALESINGGTESTGLLRLGKLACEHLAGSEKGKFERCVAETKARLLNVASAKPDG